LIESIVNFLPPGSLVSVRQASPNTAIVIFTLVVWKNPTVKLHDVGILTEVRTIFAAAMASTTHLVPKLIRCAINGEHQVLRHPNPAFPFARAFARAMIPASAGAFAIAGDFTSASALSCGKASVFCHGSFFILILSPSVPLHGLIPPVTDDLQVLNHLAGNAR